jgi:hypothetical protein
VTFTSHSLFIRSSTRDALDPRGEAIRLPTIFITRPGCVYAYTSRLTRVLSIVSAEASPCGIQTRFYASFSFSERSGARALHTRPASPTGETKGGEGRGFLHGAGRSEAWAPLTSGTLYRLGRPRISLSAFLPRYRIIFIGAEIEGPKFESSLHPSQALHSPHNGGPNRGNEGGEGARVPARGRSK